MPRTDSRRVSYTQVKRVIRPSGRIGHVQKTFVGLVGPDHRNPDGTVMTREQLYEKLKLQGKEWAKDAVPDKLNRNIYSGIVMKLRNRQ